MSENKKDENVPEVSPDNPARDVRAIMFEYLVDLGFPPNKAIQLLNYIEDMASINTTARLESKVDAQNALIVALRESQDTKYRALLWVIGVSVAVISITLTLISTLGAG